MRSWFRSTVKIRCHHFTVGSKSTPGKYFGPKYTSVFSLNEVVTIQNTGRSTTAVHAINIRYTKVFVSLLLIAIPM